MIMRTLKTLAFGICLLALPACQTMQSFESFMNDVTAFSRDLPPPEGQTAHDNSMDSAPADAEREGDILSAQSTNYEESLTSEYLDPYDGTAPHPRVQRATPVNPGIMGNFCPQVEIVEELSSLSEFTDMVAPEPKNLLSRVDMGLLESKCEHGDGEVIVDLKLVFESILGPKATRTVRDRPFFSYPFFIAVTGPKGDIMAKEVFSASMTYNLREDSHTYYESLRQIIPVPSKHQASLHKVLIGFQLNQAQLNYNRAFLNAPAYEGSAPDAQRHGMRSKPMPAHDYAQPSKWASNAP